MTRKATLSSYSPPSDVSGRLYFNQTRPPSRFLMFLVAVAAVAFPRILGERASEGEVYYAISGNLCTFSQTPSSFFRPRSLRFQFLFPAGFCDRASARAVAFLSSFGTKFLYVTKGRTEELSKGRSAVNAN